MTDFQEAYDAFFSKGNSDFSSMKGLVFQWMKSSITKVRRDVSTSLEYTITDAVEFDGYFNNTLSDTIIEYMSLWMVYYKNKYFLQYITERAERIGTKEFYRLETNKSEMESKKIAVDDALFAVRDYQNDFFYI